LLLVNFRRGIRANGSTKDKVICKDLSKSQQEIIKGEMEKK